MIYLELFQAFFIIGCLGFGGGMAIIGLIQQEVERRGWLCPEEFLDIFAISQMTPGPIGINCATYTGYAAVHSATGSNILGILGSIVSTTAIVLPSLIIMMAISLLYFKISGRWSENRYYQWFMLSIRLLVLYLIGSAAYSLLDPQSIQDGTSTTMIDNVSWIIFAVVFYLSVDPVLHKKSDQELAGKLQDRLSNPITLICLSGIVGLLVYNIFA